MSLGVLTPWSDLAVGAGAAAVVLGALGATFAWARWGLVTLAVAALAWRGWRAVLLVVLGVASLWHATTEWRASSAVRPQQWSGWVKVVTDPQPRGRAVVVVLELDGDRFECAAYGGARRRVSRLVAGEWVDAAGRTQRLPRHLRQRRAAAHIIGAFTPSYFGDVRPGSAAFRAANRLRDAMSRTSARTMPADEWALYLGLVIGDDRAEPESMVTAFRSSGLSHLTAVSGQNVAFVLLAASPLLRRLRPAARWFATLGLIGWFALLTRLEPSVLRASAMAAIAATAFWRGWRVSVLRSLAITVVVLVSLDPLLVWSVGWWLSVSATVGIGAFAAPLRDRIPGPRWLATTLGVSLAAQAGALPVSALVFSRAPLVAPVANFLAGPVAGLVMVIGIPLTLLAAVVGFEPVVDVLQTPALLGTRWVWIVARLAETVEPAGLGRWPLLVHAGIVVAILARTSRREVGVASAVGPTRLG